MKVAIITIVSGRHDHLDRQHRGLAASTVAPDTYVAVAMNDPEIERWNSRTNPDVEVLPLRTQSRSLPLAAARNVGAARALAHGAELLVFLDVDCIPAPDSIEHFLRAAREAPDSILMGAVGYLPENADYDDVAGFASVAHFHDFRARLPKGEMARADPRLFWSLCFAVTRRAWSRIGGFCEDYTGYGGEDTDFGQLAAAAEIGFLWVGGAEAFHQYHTTSSPPVEHLDDILANARLFESRWGFWPMEGWLRDFRSLGLVEWDDESRAWRRAAEVS